ncbi:MAG: hypothetical protein HKM93_17765 [Desulfobacteraceae bacterium]|nr:hypothetical protein [Desulfobacteraceae bacterium]
MEKRNVLVVVKTYPEISRKYTETVCTAGIDAETKKLVRLYPIRFRYLEGDQQFRKYQWIKVHLTKALSDPRPESHHIDTDSIEIGEVMPVGRMWDERHAWLINDHTLFPSVEALRAAQVESSVSLGIVKPGKVHRVVIQSRDVNEVKSAISKKDSVINQLDLFETKKDLYILPVRIMIEFSCNDPACTGHKMSILDWEFGQLYRNVAKSRNWQVKIESKIMNEIFGAERDTYIILGNMAAHPQTFCVLGFFWPPKAPSRQKQLFV